MTDKLFEKEEGQVALAALRTLLVVLVEDMHPKLVERSRDAIDAREAMARLVEESGDIAIIAQTMARVEALTRT